MITRTAAIAALLLGLLPGSGAAEDFVQCLAHERFAVALGETYEPLERGSATSHTLSMARMLTAGLQDFTNAPIVQIVTPISPVGSLAGMGRPVTEAATHGASLLVALGIDAKEFPLRNEYLIGDQYPLRTVRVRVNGWVIDTQTRETLSEFSVNHAYAADSTDEALDRLTDDEMADAMANALLIACREVSGRPKAPSPPLSRPREAPQRETSANRFSEAMLKVILHPDSG